LIGFMARIRAFGIHLKHETDARRIAAFLSWRRMMRRIGVKRACNYCTATKFCVTSGLYY
jgi:hypothetical protein